jgi:hypothetical protein
VDLIKQEKIRGLRLSLALFDANLLQDGVIGL